MHLLRNSVFLLMLILGFSFCLYAQKKDTGFKKIFDGKTMKGWEADTSFWSIKNGSFVGEVKPGQTIKNNTFLIWRGDMPANFEFKAEYRISPEGNSGVNYRSERVKDVPYALKGYQADIDGANQYTGQNYEERGRGFLAMRGQKVVLRENSDPIIQGSVGNSDTLKAKIIITDWNHIHLIVEGNHMRHYINGVLMSETFDEDSSLRKSKGFLGLQVHVMKKMKAEYREIYLKEIQ